MPCYLRLENSDLVFKSSVRTLEDFERRGWASVVEKDGLRYLPGQQYFRAKFIPECRLQCKFSSGEIMELVKHERQSNTADDSRFGAS